LSHASPEGAANRPRWKRRLGEYFNERLGLESVNALLAKKTVPMHGSTAFYFLGGMAMFLFVIQLITGLMLTLYYKPASDQAFESVQAIMTEVDYGWLIRSIHSWSANLMIGVLVLHMLTCFAMRAYRKPRELTWVTGVLLLYLFLAFGFSGYLLPWNKLALFATRVGTALAGDVPVVGDQLLLLARGGREVTGDTLVRFFALHVAIFPVIAFGLLGVHLYLVQKHGMSIPHRVLDRHGDPKRVPGMPFVPHFLLRDMVGWYLALALLAALSALFPWELGEKADPYGPAPEGIKPEWYFLFMFQTLRHLPAHLLGMEGEALGVLFFGLCGIVLVLIPFLDRAEKPGMARKVLVGLAAVAVVYAVAFTIWGFLE
jgi:cytochrome b6